MWLAKCLTWAPGVSECSAWAERWGPPRDLAGFSLAHQQVQGGGLTLKLVLQSHSSQEKRPVRSANAQDLVLVHHLLKCLGKDTSRCVPAQLSGKKYGRKQFLHVDDCLGPAGLGVVQPHLIALCSRLGERCGKKSAGSLATLSRHFWARVKHAPLLRTSDSSDLCNTFKAYHQRLKTRVRI